MTLAIESRGKSIVCNEDMKIKGESMKVNVRKSIHVVENVEATQIRVQ